MGTVSCPHPRAPRTLLRNKAGLEPRWRKGAKIEVVSGFEMQRAIGPVAVAAHRVAIVLRMARPVAAVGGGRPDSKSSGQNAHDVVRAPSAGALQNLPAGCWELALFGCSRPFGCVHYDVIVCSAMSPTVQTL